MIFSTNYSDILAQIDAIDPLEYGRTRNYLDGAITKLSPYISRGLISTKYIADTVLKRGYKPSEIEAFLKELAWRDYFQQVWIFLGDDINKDIKQPQPSVNNTQLAKSISSAETSIEAIDKGIKELYSTGYMHNHMRMYVASLACNVAKSHWKIPAKWLYYHLLDADWASNACSWQWVAGSFSQKKYVANQENINRYTKTEQLNTFLDIPYATFDTLAIPTVLEELTTFTLTTKLPQKQAILITNELPSFIYNFYNIDCLWHQNEVGNRILLLEPSFFSNYPVSEKTIEFLIDLAKKNIPNLQVFVGEFKELIPQLSLANIYYKEHPTVKHYKGIEEPRDWMFKEVTGYYPSFFSYWKACKKNSDEENN